MFDGGLRAQELKRTYILTHKYANYDVFMKIFMEAGLK